MRNTYFSHGSQREKFLYEDLIIEQLKVFGHDTYYLPRTEIAKDSILGNTTDSYDDAYGIEMYVEDVNGFAGQGDLIGKFGLEMRDELTFVVSRRVFELLVENESNLLTIGRPRENDIIYVPLFKKFFQIDFVEDEDPMYQIADLPVFKLKCSMWDYSSEAVDTGITEIDDKLTKETLDRLQNQFSLESGTTVSGSLLAEQVDGNIEAFLSEDGFFMVDETDGDNLLLEDDPNYIDYIIQEVALATGVEDIAGADNLAFDTAAGIDDFDSDNDIFDFSENNPFGDPRNN